MSISTSYKGTFKNSNKMTLIVIMPDGLMPLKVFYKKKHLKNIYTSKMS